MGASDEASPFPLVCALRRGPAGLLGFLRSAACEDSSNEAATGWSRLDHAHATGPDEATICEGRVGLGGAVLPEAVDQLRKLLQRYDDLRGRLGFPGDFGERAFRGWLVLDVLQPCFGWPSERIVFGEIYDLLLLTRVRQPAVTIETKIPRHRPSTADIADFEGRLHHYGTLQYAFFTDGYLWRRLELAAPDGRQIVLAEDEASLEDATKLTALLQPLFAERY